MFSQHPRVFSFGGFSHSGPTRSQVKGAKFRVNLIGKGWLGPDCQGKPDVKVVAKVSLLSSVM